MKFKNRLKRIADVLEKLGVAGVALGIYQNNNAGTGWAVGFLILSLMLTQEN